MKIKVIILVLMIVGSIAISGELTKSENAYFEKPLKENFKILAERVGI